MLRPFRTSSGKFPFVSRSGSGGMKTISVELDSITEWTNLGKVTMSQGDLVRLDIDAIRDQTDLSYPSEYRVHLSANEDTGDPDHCCIASVMGVLFGSDFVDGVSLDPISDIVLVRQVGYGPWEADLYIETAGNPVGMLLTATYKSSSTTLIFQSPVDAIDPGLGDNTNHTVRRYIVAT